MKPRHEYKHIINYGDYLLLTNKLKFLVKKDTNSSPDGHYAIRSIYFDNNNDIALEEKIIGISNRTKYRIRFYNNDTSFIKLEKKVKTRNLCIKKSCIITKEQCDTIMSGHIEFLKTANKELFNELYTAMTIDGIYPKAIVDYDRVAYTFPIGNVRITFDSNIRSGMFSKDVFNKDLPTLIVQDKNLIVLEVKYDEFIPDFLVDILQLGERSKTSVSKYALARTF